MKTFVVTAIMKCSDAAEQRKTDVRMIYQYLYTLKREGLIERETLRGKVVLNLESVVYDVMEVSDK